MARMPDIFVYSHIQVLRYSPSKKKVLRYPPNPYEKLCHSGVIQECLVLEAQDVRQHKGKHIYVVLKIILYSNT